MPTFSYHIAPEETPLSPASGVWQEPLPLARPNSGQPAEKEVSHAEYFEAARSFFEHDGYRVYCGVLGQRLQQTISANDIQEIRIHLEKHGEFYHPACIETDVKGQTILFVLNVAISDSGQKRINLEFHNIERLHAEFAKSYLPQVYTIGAATAATQNIFFFLADWFKDYHEFHISRGTSGNLSRICVWDDRKGRYYLSREQAARLYKQAATIMTYYYNVRTFEHISPWHHAAGDFVVRVDQHNVDLKLISVRGYVPLFQGHNDQTPVAADAEQILQALLIFFLKLAIWMRLDRIDGVGKMVWSASDVVQATVEGVLDGLALKPAEPFLGAAADASFKHYLSICSQEDLFELSQSFLQTVHPEAPEISIIRQHLREHARQLFQAISKI